MRSSWLVALIVVTLALPALAADKKKEAAKPAPEAAQPKVITGYRNVNWGVSQTVILNRETNRIHGRTEPQENPDYLIQLGLPDDLKKLIPEDGKLPRRAPFRNLETMLDVDAAERKVVYYFYEDKLYMMWVDQGCERLVLKFKDWRQEMLNTFGAPSSEKSDGSMVWDQDITYCTVTPSFGVKSEHTENTLLEHYVIFLYNKKLKKEIVEWVRKNMKPAE